NGANKSFDYLAFGKMTIVAKIYVTSRVQTGIIEKSDGQISGFAFSFDGAGSLRLQIWQNDSLTYAISATGAVTTGQWIQVAVEADGTRSASGIHFYVNGVEKSQALFGSNTISGSTYQSLHLGTSRFDGSLNGKMAYAAIYKYRLLAPTELQQLD